MRVTASRIGATRPRTSSPGCRWRSRCRPRPRRSPRSCGLATKHRVAVVPRGAGSGLSGGSAGIEGALTVALTRMNRIVEIDRENLVAVVQPGVVNAELKAAVADGGPLLPARPGQLRVLHDRRQHRHERRRAVLREVRRHPRRGARAGGRHGRRPRHPDRREEREGRRRLLADASLRRLAGDARHRHRGDAAPPTGSAAEADDARLLPDDRRSRPRPSPT